MLAKAITFMCDNTQDINAHECKRGITVALEVRGAGQALAYTYNVSNIVLQPVVMWLLYQVEQDVAELTLQPGPDAKLHAPLGRLALHALAHEFRHVQQELDVSGVLPRVDASAAMCCAERPSNEAYNTDAGEADANAYADMICEKAPEDLVEGLGAYICTWLQGEDPRESK